MVVNYWGMVTHAACYPEKSPQVDRLLDTLGHNLRREVVNYFENSTDEEAVPFGEVLRHVHQRVPKDSTERLEINLRHTHLPKLRERGWIEVDNRSDTVRYHGHPDAEEYLGELVEVFCD